jgi:hypothetical protein
MVYLMSRVKTFKCSGGFYPAIVARRNTMDCEHGGASQPEPWWIQILKCNERSQEVIENKGEHFFNNEQSQ